MATIYSKLSQSGRSEYGRYVSNQRLRRAGIHPNQIAAIAAAQAKPSVMAGLTIQHGSQRFKVGQDGVSIAPYGNGTANPDGSVTAELQSSATDDVQLLQSSHPEDTQRFTIEKQVAKLGFPGNSQVEYEWVTVLGCGDVPYYADRARDLEGAAQAVALQEPGTRFRIKRVSGDRAVLRIAARKNKKTGELECYSWSS